MHYRALLEQKTRHIASLELESSSTRLYTKRENRSVSVPRATQPRIRQSDSSPYQERVAPFNNLSQMLPAATDTRFPANSSVSKSSFIFSGEQRIAEAKDAVDELNATLQTN